ncbi:hemerythrin domain-containing protein [uncultured Zhongshania sp.]|uniref:hemerythrin domain-containing protein n=1 Tax=uncultured Zhongshania sp. TaxID=1642288 RepID=UPI0030D844CD|tara:strand:+ start:6827 stop:7735 length:909 start_codon:yes stop_codon:yes gene_type:complete
MVSTTRKNIDANRQKVMHRLRSEHTYIGTLREAMSVEINKLTRRTEPDLVMLRDMLRYLMEYPDVHHHPLEDQLFAKLATHRDGVRSEVVELLAEHKDLARESVHLYHKLDALVLGDEKLQKNLLRASLTDFLELYGEHVRREETIVFPAAEALLSPEEWRDIARKLHTIDDPVFGMSVSEQYARLRRRISEGVDVAVANVVISEILGLYALIDAFGAVSEGAEELMTFNSQQLRDFKRENRILFSDSESVAEAISNAIKVNRRLIGKGWSQRLKIVKKTARAAYLPLAENVGAIANYNVRG